MRDPIVSVAIPAYNSARWLPETMASVLKQTFSELELIVVDDGSTDDTPEVVKQSADDRVRYVHQENRGLSAARNTGILTARGKYIAFLDADDLFRPNKLARQLALFEADPALGLITCGYDLIDESGRLIGEERPWLDAPVIDLRTVLFKDPLLPSTLLVSRVWLDRIGLFDESLRRYEDWEYAVRATQAGCKMACAKASLLAYRRHRANMSTARHLVPVATADAVGFMTRFFNRDDLPTEIRALKPKVFGNLYLDAAARAYGGDMGDKGREWLEIALAYDPDLGRGDPPMWVVALCGYSQGTLVEDTSAYFRSVSANLPGGPKFRRWSQRRLFGQMYATQAFKSWAIGRRTRARLSALLAFALDPTLLKNRGLVALGARPW